MQVQRAETHQALGGQSAYVVTYEYGEHDARITGRVAIVYRDKQVWLLAQEAPRDDFARESPAMTAMQRSFRFVH